MSDEEHSESKFYYPEVKNEEYETNFYQFHDDNNQLYFLWWRELTVIYNWLYIHYLRLAHKSISNSERWATKPRHENFGEV